MNKQKSKDLDTIEEENFYDDVKNQFGIDKTCILNVGKFYNLMVATNMLITLFATIIVVYCANYINLLNHQYTIAELFLTTIVLFTLWNIIIGYSIGNDIYAISTNTSLLLAIFILPLVYMGPKLFMSQFC
jgi:hypothetical protein